MDVPNAALPEGEQQHILDRVMRRKLIQLQLGLLLHTLKCQTLDIICNNVGRFCYLPYCITLKEVISHMEICQAGLNCPVPHCTSSRQILRHYIRCLKTDCIVCLPLKGQNNLDPKEWHQSITDGQRSHLVDLLMDAISDSHGYKIKDLLRCGEMEKNTYNTANTLSEYYRTLAADICQFEMDIEQRLTLHEIST